MPEIPAVAFYFAKDVVLLAGLVAFGVPRDVRDAGRRLFRGFLPVLPLAVLWTALEMANPDQGHIEFAVLGFRAYWFWWIAPFVVASALRDERARGRAMTTLGAIAIVIGALALVQFALPSSNPLNRYAAASADVAGVSSTGRVRVTSTFSYITGFTDFVVIVPALLLSVGLATSVARRRMVLLVATVLTAIAIPASGSRSPVLLGLGALAIVAYAAGLFWTRQGRRVVAAGVLAIVATAVLSATAVEGVHDRFVDNPEETRGRFVGALVAIPPLAMTLDDYPILGTGTGTLQNAATVYGVSLRYVAEAEPYRILIEQGVPGYLLVSLVRIGLVVALVRAGSFLKAAGRRGEAGGAWALAALTLPLNLVFDHIAQALYFVAVGVVLDAVVRARRQATGE